MQNIIEFNRDLIHEELPVKDENDHDIGNLVVTAVDGLNDVASKNLCLFMCKINLENSEKIL